MSKIKILFAGDSLSQTTGFSYVVSSIMKRFQATGRYEIGYATISGKDTTHEEIHRQGADFGEVFKDMKIYNVQLADREKAHLFEKAAKEFKPSIVLSSHDPWQLDQIVYSAYRDSYFWVSYLTVETPVYPEYVMNPTPIISTSRKSIADTLSKADMVIPHTKMGYNALKRLGITPHNSIYSGLDIYDRCRDDVKKHDVFEGTAKDTDFIFMTMGINSERKKTDKVIESFYKFLLKSFVKS